MAISVKNHEDRIVALEKKIVQSGYYEKHLWSGEATQIDQTLNLNDSLSKYDMICITGQLSWSSSYRLAWWFPKMRFSNIGIMINGRTYAIQKVSDTQLKIYDRSGGSNNDVIRDVIGVKFSNVILYYVSNIIYIKFKLRLNSAIAIFNRIFLHKII